MDEMLSDDNFTLTIYKMRFNCETSKTKTAMSFFDHSINVAIFSFAMASAELYSDIVKGDKSKLMDIMKAGLFHNYGAVSNIEMVIEAPESEQLKIYWDVNQKKAFIRIHNGSEFASNET